MIENALSFVAALQTLILGCIFLFLWVHAEAARSGRISDPKREDLLRCPICTQIYCDKLSDGFSTCPRCGTINKESASDSYKG